MRVVIRAGDSLWTDFLIGRLGSVAAIAGSGTIEGGWDEWRLVSRGTVADVLALWMRG